MRKRKNASPGKGFGCSTYNSRQSENIPPNERRKLLIEAVRRTESIEDDEQRISAVEKAIAQYADPTDRKAWGVALQIATVLFLKRREMPPSWLMERQRKAALLANGKEVL